MHVAYSLTTERPLTKSRLEPKSYCNYFAKESNFGQDLAELHAEFWNPLIQTLNNMQDSLRSLYNFRVLRDWGYGRPWARMHLIFDTHNDSSLSYTISIIH